MSNILTLNGVSKSFGAVTVADDVCFDVPQGQALGIIGPNGAGKTSLFNLITGTLPTDSGAVSFLGQDVTAKNAAARCRAGMARSFQIPQPFDGLSVFENALVAATQGAGLSGKAAHEVCLKALNDTGLLDKANQRAGTLRLLDRKRLELTRALCAKPHLIMLDEIAGGLTDDECTSLIDTIRAIHQSGITVIWIEHVVHALLAVVERLIVIDFGKVIADGLPKPVMESRAVKEIYLGIDVDG